MKKITFYLVATCLLLSVQPLQVNAENIKTPITRVVSNNAKSKQAEKLLGRLNEIKNIDKSDLNSNQKKSLRLEVRSIKQQLNDLGDGIYVSVGALIIILLLLIILL